MNGKNDTIFVKKKETCPIQIIKVAILERGYSESMLVSWSPKYYSTEVIKIPKIHTLWATTKWKSYYKAAFIVSFSDANKQIRIINECALIKKNFQEQFIQYNREASKMLHQNNESNFPFILNVQFFPSASQLYCDLFFLIFKFRGEGKISLLSSFHKILYKFPGPSRKGTQSEKILKFMKNYEVAKKSLTIDFISIFNE